MSWGHRGGRSDWEQKGHFGAEDQKWPQQQQQQQHQQGERGGGRSSHRGGRDHHGGRDHGGGHDRWKHDKYKQQQQQGHERRHSRDSGGGGGGGWARGGSWGSVDRKVKSNSTKPSINATNSA